jgi:CxxC motif-containing protein (DUF1111 family)
MMRLAAVAAVSALAGLPAAARADTQAAATLVHPAVHSFGSAFQGSLAVPDGPARERFEHGKALVQRAWTIPPSTDADGDGLGPLFNQRSCIACHPANGRGHPPGTATQPLVSALVRLSVRSGSTVAPHPVYGWQLNEQGIPGVPGEGRTAVQYTTRRIRLGDDGELVTLRQPRLRFRELGYGPMGPQLMTSLRVAPPLFGMGLIELVAESSILEYADPEDADGDGIRGWPNMLWSEQQQRMLPGRFGLKANNATLHQQIASAFSEDLGITTPRFPDTNCTPAQTACRNAPSGGSPEGTPATHRDIPFYLMHLAPPQPRGDARPGAPIGAGLFRAIGCAGCHRETLVTGESADYPELAKIEFHPYSDLLLHDMGPGLADGRPDQQASGSQWRTAPLWGLGLAQAVDANACFLHDGRARNVTEAILWHDGEAHAARERFRRLTGSQRASLLEFLDSL